MAFGNKKKMSYSESNPVKKGGADKENPVKRSGAGGPGKGKGSLSGQNPLYHPGNKKSK